VGKTLHVVSSYKQGERLNDYTFHVDYEGCTFATIAAQAIRALKERHHVHKLVKQSKTKSHGNGPDLRADRDAENALDNHVHDMYMLCSWPLALEEIFTSGHS
jgi:hypothetical protein